MHVYTHIVTYSYIHIHMTHYNSPSAVISSLCVKPTWDARIICYNILQCVYMHIYTCVDMILYIIMYIYIYMFLFLSTQGGGAPHDGFLGPREYRLPMVPKPQICS